jgi:hypothetical protein
VDRDAKVHEWLDRKTERKNDGKREIERQRDRKTKRHSAKYLQPNLHCERIHEWKESRRLSGRNFKEYGDAEVHEGLGEVDDCLASKVDGHGAKSNVSISVNEFWNWKKDSVGFPIIWILLNFMLNTFD